MTLKYKVYGFDFANYCYCLVSFRSFSFIPRKELSKSTPAGNGRSFWKFVFQMKCIWSDGRHLCSYGWYNRNFVSFILSFLCRVSFANDYQDTYIRVFFIRSSIRRRSFYLKCVRVRLAASGFVFRVFFISLFHFRFQYVLVPFSFSPFVRIISRTSGVSGRSWVTQCSLRRGRLRHWSSFIRGGRSRVVLGAYPSTRALVYGVMRIGSPSAGRR